MMSLSSSYLSELTKEARELGGIAGRKSSMAADMLQPLVLGTVTVHELVSSSRTT